MKQRALWLFVALVVSCVPARAADSCLTLPQARAAYPAKYLMYHLDGGRRCWTPKMQHGATARHRGRPQTPPMSVPRQTVLWPSLASLATPVDAALLTPAPATAWPLLIDVDAITADSPLAECCWPPLDEAGPPFSERWTALPSNWFQLIGGMK